MTNPSTTQVTPINTLIIGIVGDKLFITPLYGGDHEHELTIPVFEKEIFIESGVKEFPDRNYIDAYLQGMSYEDYMQWLQDIQEDEDDEYAHISDVPEDDGLPF